jgi:hypothetical protein
MFKNSSSVSSKLQNTDFELKNVFGKFSLDTLASCALGFDAGIKFKRRM